MKYDVFISYSRKDTETVNRISNALEKAKISYFVDRKGIGGGMEFPEVLSQAIIDSKLFLFVASRNSYESNFTTNEITFAFNKKRRNQILPYIIDDSVLPSRLEFVFAGINWRTMSEHPIESVLIPDIMNLLGRNSQGNVTECNLIEKKNDILPASGVTSSTKRFERKTQSARKELEPYKDMFGLYGFRDKKTYEKIIKPIWGSVGEFYEGFAFVQDKKSGKYGYINMSGELVLPYEYIRACNFSEGLASVQTESYKGVIDKKGKVVFTHNFCVQFISFHEGLALAVEEVKSGKDLKYGFIDKNGHVVITCKWGNAKDFSNGLAPVADSNGKWGYIDKSGSLIIPCQYLQADTFLKGTARVMLSPIRLYETKTNRLPHYGYINENGNFLGYEFNEKSDLLIKIAENGQYGISRKNGEEVEPCRWKHISVFENGIAIVKNANGLSGGLDISGNLIIPCQWASVKYIRGKIYGVKSPGGGMGAV